MKAHFGRILVPHDFSKPASEALRIAADLAAPGGGRLTVLHVVNPVMPVITGFPPMEGAVTFPPPGYKANLQKDLEKRVAQVLGPRRAADVECQVVFGDPHARIVAAGGDHDAIVMATTGRTGLSHLLIGSVAEKVVRHATVPVLTIRAKRAGRGRAARRAARAA
jgi:nucleotide-binding universal stress UspA family protein